YSMYISLPTSSRSIPLSNNVYKSQNEVIVVIMKWLKIAKCKPAKKKPKKKVEVVPEQLSLF
ncbi:hypothetical protein, partial [Caloranaerobacter sp. DY30410]|uniref:hypothetical protein n=1 Tax=Caloranaerobacter sp. DY30410 TaxID=3238305 RepID=UPI003D0087A1